MQIVAVLIALALTFVLGAVVIGREVNRLIEQAPRPVFDLDEAVEWVAERLAFEVSAVLSYEEVRWILECCLDEFNRELSLAALEPGPAGARDPDHSPRAVFDDLVIKGEQAVSAVLEKVDEDGLDISEAHVRVVIELQVDYLRAIGAVGPPQAV